MKRNVPSAAVMNKNKIQKQPTGNKRGAINHQKLQWMQWPYHES
ncbi:hypothetical protein [Rossellomorea marisflavi]|nr:hypothetical protein [Rossellomorea marisflavi]